LSACYLGIGILGWATGKKWQNFDEKRIFGNAENKCPGGVAQWTSHPPQEREDPGSNPARGLGF
jgi:hypothetical protein